METRGFYGQDAKIILSGGQYVTRCYRFLLCKFLFRNLVDAVALRRSLFIPNNTDGMIYLHVKLVINDFQADRYNKSKKQQQKNLKCYLDFLKQF